MENLKVRTLGNRKMASDSSANDRQFLELSEEISDWGKVAGVAILPYRGPDLPYFSVLPREQKVEILGQLQVFHDICRQALGSGESLNNSLRLVWYAIRNLNLRPPSSLFHRMSPDSVFEINNGTYQVFRSFSYFEYCSYTLEDLYCRPWTNLWRREEALTAELLDLVTRTKETEELVWAGPNTHLVTETSSEKRFAIDYSLQFMSPLFDHTSKEATHVLVGIKAAFHDSSRRLPLEAGASPT